MSDERVVVSASDGSDAVTVTGPGGLRLRLTRGEAAAVGSALVTFTGPPVTTDPGVLDALGPNSVTRTADGCTWLAWETPQHRRAWWCDGAVESSIGLTDGGPVAVLWPDPAGKP